MNFIYSAEFKRANIPDFRLSLFEGYAGTACFASDLLNPNTAFFPLFNLF